MTVYEEMGCESREEYLMEVADEYGVDEETVFQLASVLGESEDFDGLITTIIDNYM
jgi:hypothetical protein